MLFYIDPYNGGLHSYQQLLQVIKTSDNAKKSPAYYLSSCCKQAMVLRYARYLAELYNNTGKTAQLEKANRAAKILSKNIAD
jgi:hypothetical protein